MSGGGPNSDTLSDGPPEGGASPTSDIQLTYTLSRLPDDHTRVQVTATLRVTDSDVVDLTLTRPPDDLQVTATDGFTRTADGFEWDGQSDPATITYTVPANQTSQYVSGGGLGAAAVPNWTFVNANWIQFGVQYSYYGATPTLTERLDHTGRGYSGVSLAYLGNYTTATYNNQFQLIIGQTASPAASRAAVRHTLVESATQLQVGSQLQHINVFVVSSPMRGGGGAPYVHQDGVADMWVHEQSPVNSSRNVWVHEYIHTQQRFDTTDSMSWVKEASADYYAGLLTLQQNRTDFPAFHQRMTTDNYPDAVLADPSTWPTSNVEYAKGRQTVAGLDAAIRQATNGSKTFQTVFKRLNAHDGPVSVDDFDAIVTDVGGASLHQWVETYVETAATPSVPDTPAHYIRADATGDSDRDGLTDGAEVTVGANPFLSDTDGDGLADGAEVTQHQTTPTTSDTDGDTLTDAAELHDYGTAPTTTDTDTDGLPDAREITGSTVATTADTDGDGLSDGAESQQHHTQPTAPDTDADGVPDGTEVHQSATNPLHSDTDADGLLDGVEVQRLPTTPTEADTDGDSLVDGAELTHGTVPTQWTVAGVAHVLHR